MSDDRSAVPGVGSTTGDFARSQASAIWAGRAWCCFAFHRRRFQGRAQWRPRQKGDSQCFARLEDVFRRAVLEVVLVLHRHDGADAARFFQLPDVDIGQANVAGLAGALPVGQRADRVRGRDLRVRRVQLVEVDALKLQALEAAVDGALEVLGPAIRIPGARAWPQQAALRGDDEIFRVRMERFGDQLFVHVRAVAPMRTVEATRLFGLGGARLGHRRRRDLVRPQAR